MKKQPIVVTRELKPYKRKTFPCQLNFKNISRNLMNFRSNKSKIIATIAVVGTVAVVAALVGVNTNTSSSSRFGGNRLLQAAIVSSDKSSEDVASFQNFVQKHNRNYLTKEEYSARLGIFAKNLEIIRQHDPVASGYKIGVNKFADMSLEEFNKMMGLVDVDITDAS